MHFASGINPPPYETADGYLQTTEGCSHNTCLFCTYFKDQKFRKSTIEEIEADIKEIPQYFGAPKRIFLQGADGFAADYDVLMKTAELLHQYVPSVQTIGGYARIDNFYDKTEQQLRNMAAVGYADPFALSASRLLERIDLIRKYLPHVQTVTMYARTDNIASKSDEELKALKEAGVDDLYIGVECGLNDVLEKLNKAYSADETRNQCLRLNAVGIRHCDLLMLGTAGKGRGMECARATAALENEIRPTKILINTMSAFVGTKLEEEIQTGDFLPASERENLEEEREFLAGLELPDCYFWALHPLDSVKLDGVLGEEKQQMLDALTRSLEHVNEGQIRRTSRVGTL